MVFVHGEGGPGDRIPEGAGEVVLMLGPEVRRQPIGPHGTVSFQGIAPRLRGQAVLVWVESAKFEADDLAQTHRLNDGPIELAVRKKAGQLRGWEQNQPEQSRQKLEELLQIRRQLAQKHAELFSPEVVRTLTRLATLDRSNNRAQEARQELEEALQSFRELAQGDPETYLPEVVRTLNSLGALDCDDRRLVVARQELEKALQVARVLPHEDSEAYLSDLATTLYRLGTLAVLETGLKPDGRTKAV
jgi:tetratricopeptide (TPR) repeat protein